MLAGAWLVTPSCVQFRYLGIAYGPIYQPVPSGLKQALIPIRTVITLAGSDKDELCDAYFLYDSMCVCAFMSACKER